jgi:hypothetical protein
VTACHGRTRPPAKPPRCAPPDQGARTTTPGCVWSLWPPLRISRAPRKVVHSHMGVSSPRRTSCRSARRDRPMCRGRVRLPSR